MSMLHFIVPTYGLVNLICHVGLPWLPWVLRAWRVASGHSNNIDDAHSKTKHCASTVSLHTLLFLCFHILHSTYAKGIDSHVDIVCKWEKMLVISSPWFIAELILEDNTEVCQILQLLGHVKDRWMMTEHHVIFLAMFLVFFFAFEDK